MNRGEPVGRLVREALRSKNRDLRMLAAEGTLPLPLEELVRVQVALVRDVDPEVSAAAGRALLALDPRHAARVVREVEGDETDAILAFFAARSRHPLVLEAVLQHPRVPHELLVDVARRLEPEQQEVLLLRQDAIVEEPGILDALDSNPRLSPYARRRIREYRRHLVGETERAVETSAEPAPGAIPLPLAVPTTGTDAEVEKEVAHEEITQLTEDEVRKLPLPVRLQLSRGASRVLRAILIRDTNPRVALSVLKNNILSDSEVEQIATSRLVCEDVLDEIARTREWVRKYAVVHALIYNPKLPVSAALRLLPKLSVRDLRNLGRDRNVAEAVRSQARRLYRIKSQ